VTQTPPRGKDHRVEGVTALTKTSLALWAYIFIGIIAASTSTEAQGVFGRVTITVTDTTGGVIPNAVVVLKNLGTAIDHTSQFQQPTDGSGVATFDAVPIGRYSAEARVPGFERGFLHTLTVRAGDNPHTIAVVIKHVNEEVDVSGGDPQEDRSERTAIDFGQMISPEELDSLSDNPTELQQQLQQLFGPDAVIRVDSFEGQQLPPKSQIKFIRVTRDQFAAETAQPGSTFVDVVTQPGTGKFGGSTSVSSRTSILAGPSPFIGAAAPDHSQTVTGSISGVLARNKIDFSISGLAQHISTSPIVNQAGAAARLLDVRQPSRFISTSALLNYAVTPDQTLRVALSGYQRRASNLGIGDYDSPDRAFRSDYSIAQVRAQQSGPVGRRSFLSTRISIGSFDQGTASAVEVPTIVIEGARTTGGAQQSGHTRQRNVEFASDLDYRRGIHSIRAGVLIQGGSYASDMNSNYLGTYTFANEDAFEAGTPLQYTRNIGDPSVRYMNVNAAVYAQDDIRISDGLTLSPGIRYSLQTHVDDHAQLNPRFGATWAPLKSGKTTLRASVGLFNWFMDMGVYQRTLQFDGKHQIEAIVINPSYPDPGPLETVPPSIYLLGPYSLQRNLRYSVGIDQVVSPRIRFNLLFQYRRQFEFWSGVNLNPPIDGVRANPLLGNVMEALTNGEVRQGALTATITWNPFASSRAPKVIQLFDPRRFLATGSFARVSFRDNSDGAFQVSPTGTLATEWAPAVGNVADQPYRVSLSLVGSQVRNLTVTLSWLALAGEPYTVTTGLDNNNDGILNDRPAGTPRNSLRTGSQSTISLRIAYALVGGKVSSAIINTSHGRSKYRLTVAVNAINVTNHSNYAGYTGNIGSPFFGRPQYVVNPRRVDVTLGLDF
jgi:hypothetical protein